MKRIPISKRLIVLLNLPRLILHLLLFAFFRQQIREDVEVSMNHRHFKASCLFGLSYMLVFDKTFRNLFYHRIGKWKYLCYYWLPPCESFTIATKSVIAPGFLCIHPFATIVNAERIGRGFMVKNGVTIGYNKGFGLPRFGDNVSVNAQAIIVGGISIGDNAVIGAGAVVTKDVPANCVVVGNPAYILKENGKVVKRKL